MFEVQVWPEPNIPNMFALGPKALSPFYWITGKLGYNASKVDYELTAERSDGVILNENHQYNGGKKYCRGELVDAEESCRL